MNVASTQFNLKNKCLELYLSGCDGKCSGCHNKELQDFNLGEDYKKSFPKIEKKIINFNKLIDKVWILGGEPLLQDVGKLLDLIYMLKERKIEIWLWTRFEFEDIDSEILDNVDYVKVGKYEESLKCDDNIHYKIKLATSNQKIIKL